MSIRTLAYTMGNELSIHLIKRTHCYELIAAALGFKSYAALTSATNLPASDSMNIDLIRERHSDLKLESESLDPVIDWLQANLQIRRNLPDIIKRIHDYRADQDDLLELEKFASMGDHWAHYGLGLVHAEKFLEVPSDYWFKQKEKGMSLTPQENTFAEMYIQYLKARENCIHHFSTSAAKGNPFAIWKKFELFGDDAFFTIPIYPTLDIIDWDYYQIATAVNENADESIGGELQLEWLLAGASEGDINCIKEAVSLVQNQDKLLAVSLIQLANLLGYDIAVNQSFAINEDGTPYDDDIGGPMFVDEVQGVGDISVEAEERQLCNERAGQWFAEIERGGRANIKPME